MGSASILSTIAAIVGPGTFCAARFCTISNCCLDNLFPTLLGIEYAGDDVLLGGVMVGEGGDTVG